MQESHQEESSQQGTGLTCPVHNEAFVRVCLNPVCTAQAMMCSGCLIENQEHVAFHKTDIKTLAEFLQVADAAYNHLKSRNFNPNDISPFLVDFINESENVSEKLTSRYYEEIEKIDIEYELLIKEFVTMAEQQREEIKNLIKQQFEQISANYSYVLDKVRHYYKILSPEEEEEAFPDKERIFANLESASSLADLEKYVQKIKDEIAEGFSVVTSKGEDASKKLKMSRHLNELAESVEKQIKAHAEFAFVFEKEPENKLFRENITKQLQEFFKANRESVVLPQMIDIENLELKQELEVSQFKSKDFEIADDLSLPENFSPPFMHFFKENSNSLFILAAPTFAKKNERLNVHKIDLSHQFKIPYEHGTVATPQGNLFLIGGQNLKNYYRDAFEFVMTTRTLVRIPSMKRGRANHAICYMHNNIYVIGGQDSSGYLRECERYDMNAEKWFDISPISKPTAGATVCGFNNQCLYKFGGIQGKNDYVGTVEKYDVDLNYWTTINLHTIIGVNDFILGEHMESVQINKGQILLFGGKYKGDTLRHCLLFDTESSRLKNDPAVNLPFEEYFKSPKSVMVRGGYVTSIGFSSKKILCFNGQSWFVTK